MSVLKFDKDQLGNLEYSLQREMLSTDRCGGYMSTTIVCCNTRKYHGLVVAPIDESDRRYVLLSSLDETVIQMISRSIWRCTAIRVSTSRAVTSTLRISSTRQPRQLRIVSAG